MDDLSLHILDVVENSITAGAQKVEIKICEDLHRDLLKIEITDDGRGMNEETVSKAFDPFFTTKTVRRVGLGLPLFREAARMANGDLLLRSKIGSGTTVKATFQHSHIDRKPLGDMVKTLTTLIISHPEVRFKYWYRRNGQQCKLDTAKLTSKAEAIPRSVIEKINWIKKLIPDTIVT